MKRKYFPSERLRDMRELTLRAAAQYGGRVAYKQLTPQRELEYYTFVQLRDDMQALGTQFLAMGLQGKHIAVIGESTYLWVVSYLAVVSGVGVVVPLDKELPNADIAKLINKADVEVLVFSNTYAEDIVQIRSLCPQLRTVINRNPKAEDTRYPAILDLIREGRGLLENGDISFIEAAIDPDTMSVILFTSGTTGANKGVMLSHKNIMTVVHSAFAMQPFRQNNFSVLPINHTYEFNLNILGSLYDGLTICFNDSLKHVQQNLKLFQPEMSLMVPLIVESLYKAIWKNAEKSGLEDHLRYGIWFSNLLRKFGFDFRKKFFAPVLEALGGKLELIICGGAPLRPEIVKGFDDFGISVYNGYGITECSPLIAFNCVTHNVYGSVGFPIPDNQVRIGDEDDEGIGEIQVKGPNVMIGFYKDPDATKASFTEDGWFKTGDLGKLDKNGTLFITGREKNLIILANGKNVHPEELEDHLLNSIPYIRECIVFAPTATTLEGALISASCFLDPAFTAQHEKEEALKLLESDIRKANKALAPYKRINKVSIHDTEFEKTTTKKIKRFKALKEMA